MIAFMPDFAHDFGISCRQKIISDFQPHNFRDFCDFYDFWAKARGFYCGHHKKEDKNCTIFEPKRTIIAV
jgi:hypothetical protein